MGFGYIGSALIPPAFGLLIDRVNASIFPVLIILLIVSQLLLSQKLSRRTAVLESIV